MHHMKIHLSAFVILLLATSCKQGGVEKQVEVRVEANEVCTDDTIISSDSLVLFFHPATKGADRETRIMYQKIKSTDKECGELEALKGNNITQVIPFYSNLGLVLPYYLINGYKQEGYLYLSELNAYDMRRPCPVGIFPDRTSCISSKPYNHSKWEIRQGRHTDKCLILINEEEERVYVPQIGADSIPTDRYIAYQFDGSLMTLVSENVANPYLHESLADYVKLRRQNDTFSSIERVDELKNEQLRLSVWAKGRKGRKERTISEEPDIVVCGGTEIAPNCYKFEYKDTKFQINLKRPID